AAHRLAQIVQAWAAQVPDANITVAEYSSDLQAAERSRIMHMFRRGQITLLICSDLIARGLDVGHVEAVINYDVPTHMSQYTHRVGRTARAGRAGSAYTLVEASQAYHFKKMLKENDHWEPFVSRINPEAAVLETLRAQYEKALEQVSEIYN
ncbi:ATP-dependent RNA helicase dbp6, partial [Linderina pennispora]